MDPDSFFGPLCQRSNRLKWHHFACAFHC